jgi:hypothetical protein
MAMLGESMHADHDGLALAVTDGPQLVTSAGRVDASRDFEIGPCTTQLRLLVVAGFAMALLSATLALDWWNALGDYGTMVGYAGVMVFARLIWMLPAERGPVVIVTPYGVRDLRIGNEFLLWDSIVEIRGSARRVSDDRIVIPSEGPATDFETLLRLPRLSRCQYSAHRIAAGR